MRIFHIATAADWTAAQQSGAYTTSTRGVTLEQEGFLHASRADQCEGVRAAFYADLPSRWCCSRSRPTCSTCRSSRRSRHRA